MTDLKTRSAKKEDIQRDWWIVSAANRRLGRLATRVATVLRGKHKPYFTPHVDCGDFVIVVDAGEVALSGNKMRDKIYYRHTGYIGGLKEERAEDLRQRSPETMIRRAVWGMLPHNALGRQMIKKLKIYAGPDHPHQAQQPQPLQLQ